METRGTESEAFARPLAISVRTARANAQRRTGGVQLEESGPYRYARFFDTATMQPFLGEAAVVEETVAEYLHAVRGDLDFRLHIKRTRRKLLPQFAENAKRLKDAELSPRQLELLGEFKSAQRSGNLGLRPDEIETLIQLGYLRRDAQRGLTEQRNLDEALEKTLSNLVRFEAVGKTVDAEHCRAKVQRLRNRLNALTLVVTERGKIVAG